MLIGVKDSQSDLEKHYKTFCGLYIVIRIQIGASPFLSSFDFFRKNNTVK
jgi:hypothetical protein